MNRLIVELETIENPRIGNTKKRKLSDNIWNCPRAFYPTTPSTESLLSWIRSFWKTSRMEYTSTGGKSIRNPDIEMRCMAQRLTE